MKAVWGHYTGKVIKAGSLIIIRFPCANKQILLVYRDIRFEQGAVYEFAILSNKDTINIKPGFNKQYVYLTPTLEIIPPTI
jgi:hypothetical protein